MCLIALVFSDDPQKCGDGYDPCPAGYTCEGDKCVKKIPPTTTTTKKPSTPKPSKPKIKNLKNIHFQNDVVREVVVSGVFHHSCATRVNTAVSLQHQQQHQNLHLVRMIMTVHLDISSTIKFVLLSLGLH